MGPSGKSRFLFKVNCGHRRRERVILPGKIHGFAKVRAAQDGEPIHAVSGEMNRCADAVRQVAIAQELDSIFTGNDKLLYRNASLW